MKLNKKNILIISSLLSNVNFFLYDLIKSLSLNYHFIIISKIDIPKFDIDNITYYDFNFKRKISFFSDFKNLFKLFYLLLNIKPNLVVSITPKISFLISLVNFFLKFNRIHFFTGQVWINMHGLYKYFFKTIDKFVINTSIFCFVDSKSQVEFLIKEGFNKDKLILINNGSVCGVDSNLFKANELLKSNFKTSHKIDDSTLILMFMGRINKDKGFFELINLYKKLKYNNINFKLVLIGNDEEHLLKKLLNTNSDLFNEILFLGYANYPEQILPCADIFILLSKREGFGLTAIQASSCSIPVIGTNIVGLQDSIKNDYTGILIDNIDNINDFNRVLLIFKNKKLREDYGNNGRIYVQKFYEKNNVITFLKNKILSILE